tara:strand:- start:923 stop:1243 length:321 start_codon:yes stop_codon:yes gene_type:complete
MGCILKTLGGNTMPYTVRHYSKEYKASLDAIAKKGGFKSHEQMKVYEFLCEEVDISNQISNLMKEYSFTIVANIIGSYNYQTKCGIKVTRYLVKELLNSNFGKMFI